MTPHDVDGKIALLEAENAALRTELEKLKRQQCCQENVCQETMRRAMIYENIVSQAPDTIVLADANYRYLVVNAGFCSFFGLKREDVAGKHVADILGWERFDSYIKPRFDRALAGENIEFNLWTADSLGESHYSMVKYVPYREDNGDITGVLVSVRDITALKRTEDALRIAQVIIDNSPVVLYRRKAADPPQLVYVSDSIMKFGYAPDEFLSGEIAFRDLVHPDDITRLRSELEEFSAQGRTSYVQEYRMLSKSGEVHWVDDKTVAVTDGNGNITDYQGILVCITERKKAENALRQSEAKFRRIIETAGEGFMMTDNEDCILDVNNAFAELIGIPSEKLKGRSPWDFAESVSSGFIKSVMQRLQIGYAKFETVLRRPNGVDVPALFHANMLQTVEGDMLGKVAFISDLTETKKALALAEEVQKSLFPRENLDIAGFDVAGRCLPCEGAGGDYYDYFPVYAPSPGRFGVVVGDVSGHGVDAALLMTMARGFLRMRVTQPGEVSTVVDDLNRHLACDLVGSGRFMTMFYMTLDTTTHGIQWVRAGHDPAMVYDPATDAFSELIGRGLPLGVDETISYISCEHHGFGHGQILALGTDGIWEARNAVGEMYGKERLRDSIRRNQSKPSEQILDAVYDDLAAFTQGSKIQDDITLVIITVL
ncbi:PAS domain S-box protein [Desulfovibrio inopinatus]|uniref:PAS domain S-box protein n=1 Tax=Desulfovibrio inopinatus TaxID=102109 RepID=UPI0003FC407A|nr:PAS domain S-box protein [Desulfovibrio inopinatus]